MEMITVGIILRVERAFDLPRQQVAFREKARKIKGCGSLNEDFYTKFKPIFKDFGL